MLPTKCEPGNVVVDFEIAVQAFSLEAIKCWVCICDASRKSIPIYKFPYIVWLFRFTLSTSVVLSTKNVRLKSH